MLSVKDKESNVQCLLDDNENSIVILIIQTQWTFGIAVWDILVGRLESENNTFQGDVLFYTIHSVHPKLHTIITKY